MVQIARILIIDDPQAKTTKKIVLRMECAVCKTKSQVTISRTKHFELGEKKKITGHTY
jgi:large subunit ribosomal protein L44e